LSNQRREQPRELLSDGEASPSLARPGFVDLGSGEDAKGHATSEYKAVGRIPLDDFEFEGSDLVLARSLGVQCDRASDGEGAFSADDVGVPGSPVLEVELGVPDGLRVRSDERVSFE
jgi:hypothetical protein